MLGDLLGEIQGRVTGQRVLAGDHGLPPLVETSATTEGEMLGVAVRDMATYTARMRGDGRLQGEGRGITMSPSGDSATWSALGVGTITGPGKVDWRGTVIFENGTGALAGLNESAVLFEYDVDGEKVDGKLWAWK